jgi:histidyl-tRNA synthetase
MTFVSLRGFRDYPPPEAGARSELRRRMRAAARRCGFVELETPSVESLELFKAKSGEEIGEQLWTFTDKGGRAVALVAETTPSLARVFVDRAKSEPLPVKWFTISRLWRYEEPQAGRTREFTQFNLDVLGVEGPEADAEVLSTAALVLDECGAAGLYRFRVNDRGLAEGIGAALGATDLPKFFRVLDRFRKRTGAEFDRELAGTGVGADGRQRLTELLGESGAGIPAASLGATLDRFLSWPIAEPGPTGAARLRALFGLLERTGLADRTVFDPSLVRGLAYYSSTVFEAFDLSGEYRSLFGGGRYDQLVELLGGPPTPAVGLAIGDQTLELLLRPNGRMPEGEPPLDTYVVAVTPEQAPLALDWVRRLRAAGRSADSDLLGRSMSRQMKEAARRRARRAIILGPRELERGVVVERDLTTGDQRERAPDAVLAPE